MLSLCFLAQLGDLGLVVSTKARTSIAQHVDSHLVCVMFVTGFVLDCLLMWYSLLGVRHLLFCSSLDIDTYM